MVAEVSAGGETGLGYTYADACIVSLIAGVLGEAVQQHDAMDPPAAWRAMQRAVRNIGREGLAATAIAAVDTAIWDLKAKLLGRAAGAAVRAVARRRADLRQRRLHQLQRRYVARDSYLAGCERDGCRWVKMKIGTDPDRDPHRVRLAKRCDRRCMLVRRCQRRLRA